MNDKSHNGHKKTLAIVFGGESNEHEISCISAANVAFCVDLESWDLKLIGITKDGRWLKVDSIESIRDGSWTESKVMAWILPDAKVHGMFVWDGAVSAPDFVYLDVIFPVLHGRKGEDGTIQGLFEMSGIPYVGCGVFASAASMDKFYTKIVVQNLGIRQAGFVGVRLKDIEGPSGMEDTVKIIEERFPYPLFIKPSRSGSSVGVSKVYDREGLIKGIQDAVQVDFKVLVEEFIDSRELECAVFGGGKSEVISSGVGEILSADVFYDYDSKYRNPGSKTVTDPQLPEGVAEKIRRYAREIFIALDCFGLARVDFFVEKNTHEVVFNEINTIPGFTAISMYPMLWEARGVSKKELIEKLIQSAFEREQPGK